MTTEERQAKIDEIPSLVLATAEAAAQARYTQLKEELSLTDDEESEVFGMTHELQRDCPLLY